MGGEGGERGVRAISVSDDSARADTKTKQKNAPHAHGAACPGRDVSTASWPADQAGRPAGAGRPQGGRRGGCVCDEWESIA